ncbi:MAG TPA: PHP domain-containing protein [Baekduia sp.]|nr:PHP domain-containing protein [Baekduia sp.]
MAERFAIAQVTPYPWEDRGEVNTYIRRTSAELAMRGHSVVIVAPSADPGLVRSSRRSIERGEDIIASAHGEPVVLAVSEAVPLPNSSRARAALPVDATRTVESLLTNTPFDIVHVHEPFGPSVSSTALRFSRSLNVGSFHAPAERVVATQVTRKLVQLLFGRLDARLASFEVTAELLARNFPADYEVLPSAADPIVATRDGGVPVIAFLDQEERGALRTFLRALRRLDLSEPWKAVVVTRRGVSTSVNLSGPLAERVEFVESGEQKLLGRADVLVLASDGALPQPALALRAIAAGAVPLASSLAVYEEVCGEGEHGLLFAPRDTETLAAQLQRLIDDPGLRDQVRDAAQTRRGQLDWGRVVTRLERVYSDTAARRHPTSGDRTIERKVVRNKLIDVDLHMHTDHSNDCATPVEHLLATAREQDFGAIAITDHNEVSGAFEGLQMAADFGVKVIIGEEVKTGSQGEVIGLFLQEKIPRGLTLRETVDEIKRQGGLVYVPHPFDRMHAVPDYEHLLTIVEDIDAIEVYNPRVAIGSFNEEAERFAAKYRIVRAAGSDAHVAAGLGSVRVRMRDFSSPEEFKESLRSAEILTKPGTLLYVQALKFLETKATPAGAKRARRDRRVRRATRNS